MKKGTKIALLIIVILLVICFLVLLGIKISHNDAHKVKNSDAEIKDILKKEKEFLDDEIKEERPTRQRSREEKKDEIKEEKQNS